LLLYQQLPRPLEAARRLLLDALDRHKSHVRTAERNADCRRVACIRLIAADERLDVGGRDQPHLMTLRPQRPPPVVRRAARLEANQRRRQLGEKCFHLRTAQALLHNHGAGGIFRVHLEDQLPNVQANFPMSKPIVIAFIADGLLCWC
jgi:hypothetical protein